jgi:hypothetical protein
VVRLLHHPHTDMMTIVCKRINSIIGKKKVEVRFVFLFLIVVIFIPLNIYFKKVAQTRTRLILFLLLLVYDLFFFLSSKYNRTKTIRTFFFKYFANNSEYVCLKWIYLFNYLMTERREEKKRRIIKYKR